MSKTKKNNENAVSLPVGKYLEQRGRCFWRSNNIPAFNRTQGGGFIMRKLPKFTPRGLPDFFVVAAGQIYALECKRPKTETSAKTYQSKEQKEWQAGFEKHGGRYFVVRSVEDVMAAGL